MTLLLRDATPHELIKYREELVASGVPDTYAEAQLGDALSVSELLSQHRRKATELAALNDIAGRLASVTDVEVLLQEIVEQARNLLHVDLAYLSLVNEDTITIVVTTGQISSQLNGLTMPVTEGFSSSIVANGAPEWTSDYPDDDRFEHHSRADAAAHGEKIRGLLGVPMLSRGDTIGVLFAGKRQERTFIPDEIELLTSLAAHASVALENSRALTEQRRAAEQSKKVNQQLEAILDWDRTLTQAALHGGDGDDFVAAVAEKANCRVLFLRRAADLPSDISDDVRDSVETVFAKDVEVPHRVETEACSLLAMPVVASGHMMGALVLCRSQGQERSDHSLIVERAAPLMALLLVGQRAAEEAARKTKDGLLVDLLTRPAADRRSATIQARMIGLDPSRSYTVVVVLPTSNKMRVRQAVDRLSLPEGSVIGEHGRLVVVLVPEAEADRIADTWFDARGLDATVGISGSTNDVTELRKCFDDAAQTVDVMLTLDRQGEVGTAERLGIYRILLSNGGPREVERLYRLYLGALCDEEERSGVPLIQTLDVYLRNSQRHAATAAELNVHSNTLYQRLDKLSRILGPRWKEPDRALDLQLILRLKHSAARLDER
ncbi:hypothetical protein Z051_03780 [Rhodococcus rhodochrous KG-21]|uniref:GAF domain-containing protein n=1 Tax=Rhodococcus rhodochrous KG-21 TaxID=1441923 RepID=A0A0M8PJL3_RHORH|nr:hypothetical protein Z051_03780 [Rhodococcus rhodochrous KG-21]